MVEVDVEWMLLEPASIRLTNLIGDVDGGFVDGIAFERDASMRKQSQATETSIPMQ